MNLMDFILPKTCIYCHKLEDYVCDECFDIFYEGYGKLTRPKINSPPIYICFKYNKAIETVIHLAKHKGYYQIAKSIGKLMVRELKREESTSGNLSEFLESLALGNTRFIPIPLSKAKEKRRGFNQVDLIIEGILDQLSNGNNQVKITEILRRRKDTNTQIGLNRSARETNLRGAFTAVEGELKSQANLNYVLVDDIFTTGTTVEFCLKALSKVGIIPDLVLIFAKN